MESVSQNVGVCRGGAGCFFLELRAAGLEDPFLGVTFLFLEPLLGEDLGFLTGMGSLVWIMDERQKIIAQMVCFL